MKKCTLILSFIIILFGQFDLYAGNPFFFSYGFGNFGPNHQLIDEEASFQEIQLKLYAANSVTSQLYFGFGLIFNKESGQWIVFENEQPYDVKSRLLYLFLNYDKSYKYFGYHIGALYFTREYGFFDSGPRSYLKPSIGIKVGMMNRIYLYGEYTSDLIYTSSSELSPLLLGVSIKIDNGLNLIRFGYFEGENTQGIELGSTFSVSNNIFCSGQSIYRPKDHIYTVRIGIGMHI